MMRFLRFTFKNEAIWTVAFPCAAILFALIVLMAGWLVHWLHNGR